MKKYKVYPHGDYFEIRKRWLIFYFSVHGLWTYTQKEADDWCAELNAEEKAIREQINQKE